MNVDVLLSSAVLVAAVTMAGQLGVKLLDRRRDTATAQKTTAEADKAAAEGVSVLMQTWMDTVLTPTKERAERAEAKADQALAELDGLTEAIEAHQDWDVQATREIQRLGGVIGPPPPLRHAG